MAIGTRAAANLDALEQRHPLIASAARVQLSNPGWKNVSRIDEAWQRESWNYYRLVGAFHYGANWAADACSRAEIYAADVDEMGVIGEATKDPEVAALVENLFGSPTAKARMIAAIAVSLIVAGETYVIGRGGRAGSGRDEWMTAAPYEVRPYRGGIWIGTGSFAEQIADGSALVFRCWKAIPDTPWLADAPGLPLLNTCRELVEIAKFKAAQTDSRLANAGIYPLPAGMDFATDDGTAPGAPSLQRAVVEAAEAALQGKGSAAQISPIFFEVDKDLMQFMFKEPIRFGSIMSDQISQLEEVALKNLAVTLNLPPEVVLGTGTSNQWSAWEIGESAVKYHIEPLLAQILDQIQVSYFGPAVARLRNPDGSRKDPKRFCLMADTSALTVRPNRATDALNLYNADVPAISAKALRAYNDFKETDAPDEEELTHRQVQKMLIRDPQLIMDPKIVESSGLKIETSVPVEGVTPPPPVPGRVAVEGKQPMPERPGEAALEAPSIIAAQVAAMARVGRPSPLLAAASAEVHNALRLAGNRLTTPAVRKEFPGVPPTELHTRLRVADDAQAQKLTAGAFGGIEAAIEGTGVDPTQLRALLAAYTHSLLKRSIHHDRNMLASYMADHGLQPWQS